MGKEHSRVMEGQREEKASRPHEQDLSVQTSCISLYMLSRTKAALFLTFFPGFLLSCFLSLLYLSFLFLFLLYSGEIVVDANVLELRSSLRPAPNIFTLERPERQTGSWA